MEIKRASINEVHWSIGWNASQQANLRLKEKLGELSRYFAPLKVGHATYNWIVDTPGHWLPLAAASAADRRLLLERIEQIRQDVYERLASEDMLASKICQVPNYEEYIFWQRQDDDLDILITGWGFHNFRKAGPYTDTWPQPQAEPTTIEEPEPTPEKEPEPAPAPEPKPAVPRKPFPWLESLMALLLVVALTLLLVYVFQPAITSLTPLIQNALL